MSSVATTETTLIDSKKPNTKQELLAANIKLLIEQLEAGHSEALTTYLTAMSRFHQYSFGNVLEIARQMPTATRVAGFWTWKNMGRNVKAGQKGICILAPIVGVRRKKGEEAEKDITKQTPASFLAFATPTSSKDYLVICGLDSARSEKAPRTSTRRQKPYHRPIWLLSATIAVRPNTRRRASLLPSVTCRSLRDSASP